MTCLKGTYEVAYYYFCHDNNNCRFIHTYTYIYLFIYESEERLFYRSFNVWFLSIFFSRLYVQTTRDGRSGKDSLFGRLESRAPFITPVLTVYVISLGERQNGQAECGAKKKLSDPEME